jgi:hypothetical protein
MRHVIIFILIIFFIMLIAAIRGEALDLSYGVKAGSGLATFSGESVPSSFDRKFSLSVGGFMELKLMDMIRVQPEVLLFYKGSKYDDLGVTGSFHIYYIDIPVLFKFYSMFPLPVGLHTFLGPYAGFNLASKAKVGGVTSTNLEIKTTDFGFQFGLGVDVWKFTIDARTSFSLASISSISTEDTRNSVLSLMVGYRLK